MEAHVKVAWRVIPAPALVDMEEPPVQTADVQVSLVEEVVVVIVIKVFGLYSLVSTEVLTRPSSPSRHCTHGKHFNSPGDIPEQLAAFSAHALSTALFMLGTHFAAG